MSSLLVVEFCGERRTVPASKEFTFGRAADLRIDDNPYLHRVIGHCFHQKGWWWLANVGSHLPLHLRGESATAMITLAPGGTVPLVLGPTIVQFSAGRTAYELSVDASGPARTGADRSMNGESAVGTETIDAAGLPLTTDDLVLLIALSETRLRRGPGAELPANQHIIERVGWTTTKFNRRLDHLCERFARRGVDGLIARNGRIANGRRSVLVDHVIASGMVTAEQLSLLPGTQPPRRTLA